MEQKAIKDLKRKALHPLRASGIYVSDDSEEIPTANVAIGTIHSYLLFIHNVIMLNYV